MFLTIPIRLMSLISPMKPISPIHPIRPINQISQILVNSMQWLKGVKRVYFSRQINKEDSWARQQILEMARLGSRLIV